MISASRTGQGPGQAAEQSASRTDLTMGELQLMALHHAKPNEVVDLEPLGGDLKAARTTAIVKADHFEAIRLIVHADTEISAHKVSGEITLHCLEGHVEIGLDLGPIVLRANEWVYLQAGASHSVKGIEDSALLLTIFLDH